MFVLFCLYIHLYVHFIFYRYKMSNDCVIVVEHRPWIHYHHIFFQLICFISHLSIFYFVLFKQKNTSTSISISIFYTSIHLLFYFGTICCIDSLIIIWPQFRSICIYYYYHHHYQFCFFIIYLFIHVIITLLIPLFARIWY